MEARYCGCSMVTLVQVQTHTMLYRPLNQLVSTSVELEWPAKDSGAVYCCHELSVIPMYAVTYNVCADPGLVSCVPAPSESVSGQQSGTDSGGGLPPHTPHISVRSGYIHRRSHNMRLNSALYIDHVTNLG